MNLAPIQHFTTASPADKNGVLGEKSLTLIIDLQDDSYTAKIKHIHEALQERSMVLGFREIRLYIFKVLQYEFGLDKKKKVGEKCNL